MTRLFWVCLAGGVGTGVRYGVAQLAVRWLGVGWPWGTFFVNVVGCFLMSIVAYAGLRAAISDDLRLTLATGFLGGLTTYSAFNWETLVLVHGRGLGAGLANLGGTLGACAIAGVLGLVVARAVLG